MARATPKTIPLQQQDKGNEWEPVTLECERPRLLCEPIWAVLTPAKQGHHMAKATLSYPDPTCGDQ
jgi:hypothetical protein